MDSQREHERKLKMEPLEFACLPVPDDDSDIYALYDNSGDIWASGILESAAPKIMEAMNEWAGRGSRNTSRNYAHVKVTPFAYNCYECKARWWADDTVIVDTDRHIVGSQYICPRCAAKHREGWENLKRYHEGRMMTIKEKLLRAIFGR